MNQAQRDQIDELLQAGQYEAALTELQRLAVWDDEAFQAAKRLRELHPIHSNTPEILASPLNLFYLWAFLNLGILFFLAYALFTSTIENTWGDEIIQGAAFLWLLLAIWVIFLFNKVSTFYKGLIIVGIINLFISAVDPPRNDMTGTTILLNIYVGMAIFWREK